MILEKAAPTLRRAGSLLRAHYLAVLLALLVGAIYAGPDIYYAHTAGYRGIEIAESPDSVFYLSIINKSYQNPGRIGDPFQYEYRDAKNPFQYFGIEFVLGKLGSFLTLPIDRLTEGMSFFFPAFLTVLLYAFTYALSRNRLIALLASGAMLLGNELILPNGLGTALQTFLFHSSYREFMTYVRPISPQANALFFYAVIASFLYLLRNPTSRRAVIISGLALGVLFYIYVYFWAFAAALL